ncbi:hypothetical protein [Corynebacterium sp. HMSC065A05]|uniref:hypothetical protein n=1 Tax=Corynebacterium sp. HMSC065A05 TaxID=1739502 RepID=UPI001438CD47|nr:hypothetical protein [Corynebacterium sp. HMSC065A05]
MDSGAVTSGTSTPLKVSAWCHTSFGATLILSGMGEDKELWFENAAAAWDY